MNIVSFQLQQTIASARQTQLKGSKFEQGVQERSPFQTLMNQSLLGQSNSDFSKVLTNELITENNPLVAMRTSHILDSGVLDTIKDLELEGLLNTISDLELEGVLKSISDLEQERLLNTRTDLGLEGLIHTLLSLFEEIAEEIPFVHGYLNLNESIELVLNDLPDEMKSELVAIFQSNMPIEQLLRDYKQSGSPQELVAAFIFFNELQATGQAQLSSTQQQALTSQMQKLVGRTNEELPPELKQVINRLLQQTNEQSKSNKLSQPTNFVEQTLLNRQETSSQGLSIQTFGHDQTVMSRAQQMTIHVGEQLTKEAEHQQFQRQFQEMMNRGLFRNLQNGLNQLSIKLYPEHLGRLDIQITQLNGIITARIMASTQVAKELIEGQLQNLRQAFAHQQLQVERIEVTQQEQAPLYQSARDEQGKEQQNQHARDKEEGENQENNETFSELLEEFTFMEKV